MVVKLGVPPPPPTASSWPLQNQGPRLRHHKGPFFETFFSSSLGSLARGTPVSLPSQRVSWCFEIAISMRNGMVSYAARQNPRQKFFFSTVRYCVTRASMIVCMIAQTQLEKWELPSLTAASLSLQNQKYPSSVFGLQSAVVHKQITAKNGYTLTPLP